MDLLHNSMACIINHSFHYNTFVDIFTNEMKFNSRMGVRFDAAKASNLDHNKVMRIKIYKHLVCRI